MWLSLQPYCRAGVMPVLVQLYTHLIWIIVDSWEFVFDLIGMLVLLSLYVCIMWDSIGMCVSMIWSGWLWVTVSLRPVFQIKAFMVSARWRGHDSQLAHTKLIQLPICVCTCVFPNQCSCFIGQTITHFIEWLVHAKRLKNRETLSD